MNPEEKPTLDDLLAGWQREDRRLGALAAAHPVEEAPVNARAHRHPCRWQLAEGWLRIALCLLVLLWLVATADRYVVDTLDLVAHLLVGALLLSVVAVTLRTALLMRLRRLVSPHATAYCRPAAAVVMAAMLLVAVTPAYAGRTMAGVDRSDRAATIATLDQMLAEATQTTA